MLNLCRIAYLALMPSMGSKKKCGVCNLNPILVVIHAGKQVCIFVHIDVTASAHAFIVAI